LIVFDGANLPAKRKTEEKRRETRSAARLKAMELKEECDSVVFSTKSSFEQEKKLKEMRKEFTKSVNVTPQMASEVIKSCAISHPSIQFVVSPYEADAQLASLCLEGFCDGVITEDSDAIVYGCPLILFKVIIKHIYHQIVIIYIYC